jgi:sulfite dehydrogenase (cytochrome) subunit B
MKKIFIILILLAVAAGFALAQEKQLNVPVVKIDLAPGEGKDKAETLCNICHSLDYITTQPRSSKAAWAGSVTKMRKVFGAPISDADAAVITNYLAANYGNGK